MNNTCATCRFWDRGRDDFDTICRRHVPVAVIRKPDDPAISRYPVWPLTISTEWCGEHEASPDTKKE